MTDDIVERLLCPKTMIPSHEAAEEITRLRTVNKKLLASCEMLQRCGQKQGWNDNYEYEMDFVKAAIAKAQENEQ